jgi:PKD repeat protein
MRVRLFATLVAALSALPLSIGGCQAKPFDKPSTHQGHDGNDTGEDGDGDDDGGSDDGGDDGGDDTVGCGDLTATVAPNRNSGAIPLDVTFSLSTDCAADGEIEVSWDFGDSAYADSTAANQGEPLSHTWLGSGTYTVSTTVLDADGETTTAYTDITVYAASCPETEPTVTTGTVANDEITEASGIIASRLNPNVLWTHNDSGDGPRLFALDSAGTHLGQVLFEGVPEGDWEDVATGPHPTTGEPALFVVDNADAGLVVHIAAEPLLEEAGASVIATEVMDVPLTFADGEDRDIDTLMVDPVTGDLYLAVLETNGNTAFWQVRAPLAETGMELRRAGQVDLAALGDSGQASGAEFSPLGDLLMVRTNDGAWMWRWDRTQRAQDVLLVEPCPMPTATEPQGEAIGFAADGGGYWTVSEEAHQPLYFTPLVPAVEPCEGLEVRIVADASSGGLPYEPTLSISDECLPAGIASVTWDLGDGTTATDATASPLYLSTGVYAVTADVVDNDGQSVRGTIEVEALAAVCPTVGTTTIWGTVAEPHIIEASGVVHSVVSPGVMWTHNDAGNDPELFAFAEDGTALGRFDVISSSRDWEDMDAGWDDTLGTWALYIGDIGDNAGARASIFVQIIEEPVIDPTAAAVSGSLSPGTTLELTYPDGLPHNSETLMLDPVTGDLYIVVKDYGGTSGVYRKPAPHVEGTSVLEHVVDLVFGEGALPGNSATTAGAFSPLGDRIAIRTYSDLYMWRRDQAFTIADAFADVPCDLHAPAQNQGEAMAWSTDGAGYLLVSEGRNQPILYRPVSTH